MDIVGGQNYVRCGRPAGVYGDKRMLIFESCEGIVRQFSYASRSMKRLTARLNLFYSLGSARAIGRAASG